VISPSSLITIAESRMIGPECRKHLAWQRDNATEPWPLIPDPCYSVVFSSCANCRRLVLSRGMARFRRKMWCLLLIGGTQCSSARSAEPRQIALTDSTYRCDLDRLFRDTTSVGGLPEITLYA
jgi:hypothetical protein